jgi:hypothetical protein
MGLTQKQHEQPHARSLWSLKTPRRKGVGGETSNFKPQTSNIKPVFTAEHAENAEKNLNLGKEQA